MDINKGEICKICYHPKKQVDSCTNLKCSVCRLCYDTGLNYGVQCERSKAHPTGWKTDKCDCGKVQ